MSRNTIFMLVICALLALGAANIAAPAAAQDDDPSAVINSFYAWYLDYAGYDPDSDEFRNPLADGSYQERPELSPDFVQDVIAIRDEQGGFFHDPFLCAQDVPESVEIVQVDRLTERDAAVLVQEFFGWNPRAFTFVVAVTKQDDAWLIRNVICQESITPRGVTESFYTWYLEQVPASESLAEDYPFLTDALNARIQEQRGKPVLGGGDPVLCAQDIPNHFAVDEVMVGEDEATMLVREFFSGNPQPHTLTVRLMHDEQWLIDDIVCEVAPETVAARLYNEYITNMRYDIDRGIDRTPIGDWSPYPWAQYMSQDLLDELLAIYRSGEVLPADPFLCAQDIPTWMQVRVVDLAGDSASLRVMGAYPSGPDSYTTYDLVTAEMALSSSGDWQLSNITCGR